MEVREAGGGLTAAVRGAASPSATRRRSAAVTSSSVEAGASGLGLGWAGVAPREAGLCVRFSRSVGDSGAALPLPMVVPLNSVREVGRGATSELTSPTSDVFSTVAEAFSAVVDVVP